MKKTVSFFFIFALSILTVSCKKEPVIDFDENFEGSWRHYRTDVTYTEFYIQSDSKGEIEYIEENGKSSGTFSVKWLIKGNKLYHGWFATKHSVYVIDKYPTIAETEINNNFDFIPIGKSYMILDGEYYVRSN